MSRVVFEKIKKMLEQHNVHYVLETHEKVYTSEEAAKARGRPIIEGMKRGAKAMILKIDGEFIQFVLPAYLLLDMKKIRQMLSPKKIRLATAGEVVQAIDCEPGAVPPFGNLFKLKVYADPRLAQEIDFNAGLHDTSMTISKENWKHIVKPIFAQIGKERS